MVSICTEYLSLCLHVSSHLKGVSCRQQVDGSCVLFNSLCLLTWEFSSLTFKVIVDRFVLITIFLIVFWMFLWFFSVPCFFCSFPLWFDEFFSGVLIFLSLYFFCIYCRCLICGYYEAYIQ